MKYKGIQCLRTMAASMVIGSHLINAKHFQNLPWLHNAINAGAVGVDIFFVISGFVIAMSAVHIQFKWIRFLIQRYSRIVPFYILISAPMACYMFYKNEVNWHSWLNTLFFIPVTDFDRFTDPILALGWTLSFEFWFYSLFALFIGLLGRKSIVVLPLCLVSMSIITCFFYHSHWFLPKFLFHPFTIEFSFGILIYKLANKLRMVSFIVSFMAVIFLGYLVLESAQKYYLHNDVLLNLKIGMDRTIIWGSFALSLVVMTISIDNIRLFTWPEWLVLTGDRSYSIYLIQVYSLSVFLWFSIHLGIDSNSPIYYIITFISTIIIGIAISNLVEFPLARYFKKVLEQSAVKMKLVQPAFNIKA